MRGIAGRRKLCGIEVDDHGFDRWPWEGPSGGGRAQFLLDALADERIEPRARCQARSRATPAGGAQRRRTR
ncbi:MAG: hypothetical protein ACYCYH_14065, partial [Steroidobacteraceae bacterium]